MARLRPARRKAFLRYLGPAIVLIGAIVAAVGAWYAMHARPKPGEVIDTIDLGDGGKLVVRNEAEGQRAFVELHGKEGLRWQALVPHYAGNRDRRAIAWGTTAVGVRVERGGRSEVFALAMRDGHKLGGRRLAPDREPNAAPPVGPITLTDHAFSYEFVSGPDWHRVVCIDLATGKLTWTTDLGSAPVTEGRIDDGVISLTQRGQRRTFDAATGREHAQYESPAQN